MRVCVIGEQRACARVCDDGHRRARSVEGGHNNSGVICSGAEMERVRVVSGGAVAGATARRDGRACVVCAILINEKPPTEYRTP